jgi:Flp pilus assembly protein TadD
MTGALWQSGFVAALFALHPLHVESVAWVAERKDVLSTFFWLLTMWTYVRYVERPGPKWYILTFFIYGLGLMAKPMLVTLPFVLLLLDYWPLNRLQTGTSHVDSPISSPTKPSFTALVWGKVPLFALAALSSLITLLAQKSGGAMKSVEVFPMAIRIANALLSYVFYIKKMVWPQGLAFFYPHPGTGLPMWQAVGAGLLLVGISLVVVRAARQQPYLLVGWFWYLGTLVPVIGLVQVGIQSMADRYTYVPLTGLFIIIGWGIPNLVMSWHRRRILLGVAAASLLVVLTLCTWSQLRHWRNNVTLFEHAINVTANNYLAHDNLGNALAQQGKIDEAIAHYYTALRIKSNSANTHNNLGVALFGLGKINEAIAHYRVALRYQSDSPEIHNNLGVSLARQGQVDEAIVYYLAAVQLKADYEEAYNNLGNALARQGKLDEAAVQFSRALEIKPNYPDAHNNLGVALARQGRLEEAISHFKEALRLKPDYRKARANLEIALQQAGK